MNQFYNFSGKAPRLTEKNHGKGSLSQSPQGNAGLLSWFTALTAVMIFCCFGLAASHAQTVLINPAGDGGFNNGSTFAANGWTAVNSANNPWIVGTAVNSGVITGNSAYVSSNGTSNTFNNGTPAVNYFYRDITVPAGHSKIALSFNWINNGETNPWDVIQVFVAPTTLTPVASTTSADNASTSPIPPGVAGATPVFLSGTLQTTVQTSTVYLPAGLAGTTFRLIFAWRNDTSGGSDSPGVIDNISLTSQVPGTYVSIASGNYGAASTWDANAVPSLADNIIVSAGHTVTVDATGQGANTATINGTLAYGATPTSFTVANNLTVGSAGVVSVFNGTTGKTLNVGGNLQNDGTINISVGTTTAGTLVFNGAAVQTLSGTGTFTDNKIRNLTFNNTSTAIPNINWLMDNISVEYNLNITNAKINLGANTLTYGVSATSAGNTFTVTNGGFMAGGKFARWWTASGTGYTTGSPTTITTDTAGRYPFFTASGTQRLFMLGRTTPTAGGKFSVTYVDAPGLTSGLSIADGSYTVTERTNSRFIVSTDGTAPAAASYFTTVFMPGAFTAAGNNVRVVLENAAISGTHTLGTTIPSSQRSGVSLADLTAATGIYLGLNASDIPVTAVASGDWNSTATWSTGVVPGCNDAVAIPQGFTVTVNTAATSVKGINIMTGGTLVIAGGDLTVGCTNRNNQFINSGTLTVSGGTLKVNGQMLHNAGATFNQSAGDIIVDGNNGGDAATSVPAGSSIVQINTQFVNWTGGMLTVVDPHANTTSSNSFSYNNSIANVNVTSGHTIRFGDGVSTDAGGHANGFIVTTFPGSNRMSFFNFIVNGGAGTNRHVVPAFDFGVNGDFTVNANSEFRDNSSSRVVYIGGNLTVAGKYLATGTVYFGKFLNGTASAATIAQQVAITGEVLNLSASATANFNNLTVNNTSATGVTFTGTSAITGQVANSVSVSGTLNFISGKLNGNGVSTFILGVSGTTLGTLSYTAGGDGGFTSGITFGRWFAPTGAGSSISAGADATSNTSRYPFVTAAKVNRSAWIERVTPAAAAGILAVTYNESAGTTPVTITDGAYTADMKANDTWAVSALGGTPLAAATFKLNLVAPQIFGTTPAFANVRVVQGNATVGTHQAGTVTPGGQRAGITPADLTAAPFTLAINAADFAINTVASGNWNDPAIWSSGTVPVCTDATQIMSGHTITVNSTGNVSKYVLINTGATLVVASGDLRVGCTNNNNQFTNSGTFTINGGNVTINGQMLHTAGSTFNQTAGDIVIDGNNGGVAATSVAAGSSIVQLNSQNVSLTGGTIMVVDPHAGTASNTFAYNNSTGHVNIGTGHTVLFGNGTSNDAGGSTNGFRIASWIGSNRITFGNVIINGASGTNRFVTTTWDFGINGNLTVNVNGDFRDSGKIVYVGGNIVNNGDFYSTGTLYLGTYLSGTAGATTTAQSISGTGIYSNSTTAVTAELTSLTVNNTSAAGVTPQLPLSLSGTLTLTAGKVNTTEGNMLTLGTPTAAGTLAGGSATAYINGPFTRTIATANTAFIQFPVGKSTYAPIWVAPTTTAVSVMRAEVFDTNTGTSSENINNLAGMRWEAPLISGAATDIKVRVQGTLTADNIIVMADAADGVYDSVFGSTATFVAGPPTTIQTNSAYDALAYTGYISYAKSNLCVGTPTPGNTIASSEVLCAGESITLSVANATIGAGVSYQWQSSADGVTFTDIATATGTTLVVTPTAPTHYQLKVTCSAGPAIGTSTPVFVDFASSVTEVVPGTRCGTGTVTLEATASEGAEIVWYNAATSGDILSTGSTYTTPSISANTTYYAASQIVTEGTARLGTGTTTTSTNGLLPFNSNYEGAKIQYLVRASELIASGVRAGDLTSLSFDVTAAGTFDQTDYTVKIAQTTATALTAFVTDPFTTVYGPVLQPAPTVGINTLDFDTPFTWDGTSNIVIEICHVNDDASNTCGTCFGTNSTVRYTATSYTSVYGRYIDNNGTICESTTVGTSNSSTNRANMIFGAQVACSSPRVPVTATVTAPPALTLSGNPAAICAGESTAPVTVTAGAADYDTYVWTPATGVTGDAATGFIFNPATTTTYTLNASQSAGAECIAPVATVVVTVNPLPSAITINTPAAVCVDKATALTITGGEVPAGSILGTGTTVNTSSTYPAPYSMYYGGAKHQMLIRASELTALGYVAGTRINEIAFNVASVGTEFSGTLEAFRIDMGHTATNVLTSSAFVTGLTNVLPAADTTIPTTGLPANVTHTLATPFVWNGTDNIVIQTSYSNNITGTATRAVIMTNSNAGFVSTNWYLDDGGTPAEVFGATTPTNSGTSRPNMVLTAINPVSVTWSPVTNLYTDAAATVPYVAGTNANTVYVKSATAGAATYTVTSTSAFGCTTTGTANITVVDGPASPTGNQTQVISVTAAEDATIEDIVVNEPGVIWFASEAAALAGTPALPAGTQLQNNTTYWGILSNGTCSSEPLDVLVSVVLGRGGFDLDSFSYYPNPVKDVLNVKYSSDIDSVSVYNMIGQQVISKKVNATETIIDMSALADGTYILNVTSGNAVKTIKVVKKQ